MCDFEWWYEEIILLKGQCDVDNLWNFDHYFKNKCEIKQP